MGPNADGACTYRGAVRPNNPKVEMRPIKPKQWSPCRWEMNTWFSRENLSRERLIWSWAPSPQSIIYNFSRMLMTCDVAKCRVVGSADPHPNIVSSNFSMPFGYELHCTKIHKKRAMRNNHRPFFRIFSCLGMWFIRLFPFGLSMQPMHRCHPKW